MRALCLLLTCEHATNRVPARYRELMRPARAALATHRGFDPGALVLARVLARRFSAPLVASDVTRLLVEANRSRTNPAVFSRWSRALSPAEREELLARHWQPHRAAVERAVGAALERADAVLHLGVHSFTPRLAGVTRTADVALLYDPRRARERELCARLARELAAALPGLRVRKNYPYRGTSDGLTTSLRRRFDAGRYLGVELELNQRLARDPARAREVAARIGDALAACVG